MVEHRGTCDKCGETGVRIFYGWSSRDDKHCGMCDQKRKNAIKANSRLVKRPFARQYEPISRKVPITRHESPRLAERRDMDKEVNDVIWRERKHTCEECQRFLPINPPPKVYFSHLLSKGAHPELRFDPLNIVLHCPACHRNWETSGKMKDMRTYALHSAYMVSKGFVPND
jgi:hypothetical protein